MTQNGQKQIEHTILEETAIIRDRIREFKMIPTMKEGAVGHAEEEAPEEEGVGAMRHNMTKREEEDVLQWVEENPEKKEDASKDFKKELLTEGRTIACKNITLGNQIFDNLIGAPQA
eukprot:328114-Heterocapsa_arctica.AAC.1